MLVVFADEEKEPKLDEQRRALGPGVKALQDRGIRLIEVVGEDPLRDALGIPNPPAGFLVLLVEKNGLTRLKTPEVVDINHITALADAATPSLDSHQP
jgi:hypothetical protein